MAEAIVLLSGGIDSAVCLFEAVRSNGGAEVTALTFDWGQLAFEEERRAAGALADAAGTAQPRFLSVRFPYHGALTDGTMGIPLDRTVGQIEAERGAAPTFFPARNLVMIAYAYGEAYTSGADEIYFGSDASDLAGYPDCRPDFLAAVESAGNLALGGTQIELVTPLIRKSKPEIVTMGEGLGVPWELTFSCYAPVDGRPCGRCDSCVLRRDAFTQSGLDPDL